MNDTETTGRSPNPEAWRSGPRPGSLLLSLILLMGASHAQADDYSGYGMLVIGAMGVSGVAASSVIGCGMVAVESSSPVVTVLAGALAIASGVTSSRFMSLFVKFDAVSQLKVDHETYLAGGAMTPLLREVYRQVRLETSGFTRPDPVTGNDTIDEARMGEAIDRLVEWARTTPARSLSFGGGEP